MQTVNPTAPTERNSGEALLDTLYGICFNNLNARFYRRLDSCFSLINVVGGTITLASAIAGAPIWAGVIGVIIAVCAYIEREIRPTEKAIRCEIHRERYGALAAKASDLSLPQIDKELRILQSTGPETVAGLARPAYNMNVTSHGYPEYRLALSKWEQVASWLA